MSDPSYELGTKLASLGRTTPITALAFLTPALLLAGSSSDLLLTALDARAKGTETYKREWRVLGLERVHKVVVQPAAGGLESWRVLVLGGKEAALVELTCGAAGQQGGYSRLDAAKVTILHRFALADWIHDAAFLSDDRVIFITAHNSLLTYTLPTSSATPILSGVLDSALRPLLWCAAFSKLSYGEMEDVLLAGGSMLGDILLWRPTSSSPVAPEPTKLLGHKGGVFNLAFSPSGQKLASVSDDRAVFIWNLEDGSCRKMWGHEGRIWRVRWISEKQVVSVAEDMKTIVWAIPETGDPSAEHEILQKFAHGHDGRSMWSVSSCLLEEGGSVVVTGGADGGVRSWIEPAVGTSAITSEDLQLGNMGGIKAFSVLSLPDGTQRVVVILSDGSLLLSLLQPGLPPSPLKTLHVSPALARSPIIVNTQNAAWIFSNRGTFARVDLQNDEVVESETGICAAGVDLDGDKMLVYDRRGKRVVVLDANESNVLPAEIVSSVALNDPSSVLTAVKLISDRHFLLYGTETGELVVVDLAAGIVLAKSVLHQGTISDIRIGEDQQGQHELETVGRDGFRAKHLLRSEADVWSIVTVDRARITRGRLEQILGAGESPATYLALVDTRALVLNAQGDELLSFVSFGARVPRQLVQDGFGGVHYFRLLSERIHRQSSTTTMRNPPPPVVLPAYHGREIRCVKFRKIRLPVDKHATLIATGAENASFRISQLNAANEPKTLFSDSTLEGALKSVAWSESANGLFVFASGARETIRAWQVTPTASMSQLPPELAPSSPSRKGKEREIEPEVDLRVLPAGDSVPVSDGGEIRLMDMGVEVVDAERGLHLVVAGCSDGVLRCWLYDDRDCSFLFLDGNAAHDKCILTVRLLRAETEAGLRHWVFTGASDGLVAAWDLTALALSAIDVKGEPLSGDATPGLQLDQPILTFAAHQSGVNGLDVFYNRELSTLEIATAGDDNAVAVHQFGVSFASSRLVLTSQGLSKTRVSAHSSTIQGLAFLTHTLLASSSVDQRLNLYSLAESELKLVDSVLTSVADCSAMDVVREEESEGWRVAVVGIGLEMFAAARSP